MGDNPHTLVNDGVEGSPRRALFAATLSFFFGIGAVALFAPAAKTLKECMQLSTTMVGVLVAMPQLSGSLLRIPIGAASDRYGGKRPILILLSLSLVGMAGLAYLLRTCYPASMGSKLYLVLLMGFLSGCGGATFSAAVTQTAYWFPRKAQGSALGIVAGLGNTSPGIFTLALPFVFAAVGLGGTYTGWFFLLLIGTVIYAVIARDSPYFQLRAAGMNARDAATRAKELGQELLPTGTAIEALKVSARNGRTWALVGLYLTSFGGFLALTTWFPVYWTCFHDLSPRNAGILTAVGFSLLASIIRACVGGLCDRRGGEAVAVASFVVVAVGAALLVATRSFVPCLIGELLMGGGMGVANAAVFKLVPKYVPEAVGGASGWVGGLGAFGGFIVPPLLGETVDVCGLGGYAYGFVVYLILSACSIAIALFLKRRFAAGG